ncbi:zf-HC2 domain-containing protein [Terrabacter sp. NPDC080008]|uniref:zf-HC2 domain-containing protein n=1 Tax=Terrabacter sp. NPDC080008 TaxID=3155176 RepID=UPI00344F3082
MTTGSDELHVLLGAYVLGGLSNEDHRAFSEHLRTCARCQAELGQVSGLPRLLELAGPRGGPHLDEGADGSAAEDGTGEAGASGASGTSETDERNLAMLVDEVGRRRRRQRGVFSGIAAAAAVATFGIGASLGQQLLAPPAAAPPAPSSATTTATPPGGTPGSAAPVAHVAVRPVAGSAVQVDVALLARGWGTQLDIRCEDMPTSGEVALWVIDRNGRATTAASWRGTPAGYSRVTGATALSPGEIRAIEVRTGSGKVLASART